MRRLEARWSMIPTQKAHQICKVEHFDEIYLDLPMLSASKEKET